MAKLEVLPAKDIISGLKGVIDFYVNYQACDRSISGPGIPCARKWPRSPGHKRAPAVEAGWVDFSYAAKAWLTLSPEIRDAYNTMASNTGLTGRDLFTRSYISGLFPYPPPT